MHVNLQPKQFLFLYNILKKIENDFMDSEQETYDTTKALFENVILNAFNDIESKALETGFDKWVKSETNKIQGLEEELKKIKETTPLVDLVGKFTPVKKNVSSRGRPKKK